ncbi:PAS-domain containing protein [Paracoccus luteus]|uniref:PAS-domain containing protein n=1 Tax=Paracoccus luteus TaxID=2508543 RepID=UPI002483277E|nr:PAS-domain containing protein [Paracoccus luteus]
MSATVTMVMALAAGTLSVMLALLAMRLVDPLLDALRGRGWTGRRASPDFRAEPVCLLLRDGRIIDATGPARTLLATLPGDSDWQRLLAWLAQRFDDPQAVIRRALAEGRAESPGGAGLGAARLCLAAEDLGAGVLRLTITDPAAENAGIVIDSQSLAAMEEELAVLRESMDHAPVLIWREDAGGAVTWANAAYLHEVETQADGEVRWPMPRLIDTGGAALPRRASITLDDQVRWYDCHARAADGHRMIFAVPADDAVRAERSLREFVQTLTKTFADLPIGLAIFDRERRLQLFNPALIDLTGLATGFLTARPTLYAVLDALRESRMAPEPKDYRSWRNMMATLEAAAASGHHVETWSLPGGQTYRVTGRPHPDGAIAFLFEDITSEMALTRRFRAELALGAEVLDAVGDALAVFDADGRLISANRAYGRLWGDGQPSTLRGHQELWRRTAGEGAGFDGLRSALSGAGRDETPRGAMAAPGGGLLSWTVRGLSGARRMVLFGQALPQAAAGADSATAGSGAGVAAAPVAPDARRAALAGAGIEVAAGAGSGDGPAREGSGAKAGAA